MTFADERTPLIKTAECKVFNRFTRSEKRGIMGVVSCTGLIPFFTTGCFVPSIVCIAEEFESTPSVISLAVSLSLLSSAVGTLILSTYAGYYGRRAIFLFSLPIFVLASLGVAASQSVFQLMLFRVLQAFGSTVGLAVGAAVVSDIYALEERGAAMGLFLAAVLTGPTFGPIMGGVVASFAHWRWMHVILASMGLVSYVLTLMSSLKRPILAAKYHITEPAYVGLLFVPMGVGSLISAPIAGRLSDRDLVIWRARRGGLYVPEDRLRRTFWGSAVLVPLSVGLSGLITKYVDGPLGLALNVLCLFANGVGVDFVFSPSTAYSVDILHSHSAEIIAAAAALRSFLCAFLTAGIVPLVNKIGMGWTNGLSALLALLFGHGLLWLTMRYGDHMRAWNDVGYTISD